MARAGVPVVPGYGGERQEPEFLKQKAYEIGYPVLVKAVAGGGGRGMRRVDRAIDFDAGLAAARREAEAAFGDGRVLIERYVDTPRHIEVQVFADAHGNAVHLFERDCSVQRRHQKVLEEAPAPGLPVEVREVMGAAAVQAAAAVGYRGAGTVEFIASAARGLTAESFYFMEMNTRLQVEHPVTEAVTGLDLVEWQLRVAAGEPLPLRQEELQLRGHAIEVRLYAEDPAAGFRPATGRLWAASFPSGAGIRVDSGVEEGTEVSPFYDSMLAKVIAHGATRTEALERLSSALESTRIAGPKTNLAFLTAIANHPDFMTGGVTTDFVDRYIGVLTGSAVEPGIAAPVIESSLQLSAETLSADTPGSWARTDSFEIGGLARRSELAVELDGVSATAAITWLPDGPRVESIDGRPPRVQPPDDIVWGGGDAYVLHRGATLRVSFPDPLARDLRTGAGSGDVTTPMHGRIVTVAVSEGSRVAAGDLLFTLEAMKMEHSVTAPVGGEVGRVSIVAGQQVEQGQPAVSITPRESGRSAPVE
jgi:3-methylcrotonyl-CoA carboxylase alpha subunit